MHETAQAVDLGRAELHQLLTHAMQRQNRLLLLALDGNRLDARLLNRRPDRSSVVRIVLVAADERSDHLRRYQTHLMTQLQQPTRPVLRAAAGLHPHQAGRPIGEMLQELRPCQPLVCDLTGLHVDPVQLKHPLCDIHADDRSATLHVWTLRLPGKTSRLSPLAL